MLGKLLYPAFPGASGCSARGRREAIGTASLQEETVLSKNSKDVVDRAEASFRKEERAREGAKAMRDYEAEGRAVREKTARLKLLRLAKEATEKKADPKKSGRQSKPSP
jgi:CRISPR/Cas system-associated protein Cas5 (RAMP superfamily)